MAITDDKHRVYLATRVDNRTDYINAVWLQVSIAEPLAPTS